MFYLSSSRLVLAKGHKVGTLTRTTRREAKIAVDTFVSLFLSNQSEQVTQETIDTVVLSVSNDLQVRDYLLGLPIEHTLDGSINALEIMASYFPEGNRKAIYSILSAYHYEADRPATSFSYLNEAIIEDGTYSLAQLLGRVYQAGLPIDSFVTMRNELHAKVVEALDEDVSIPETE